MNCEKIWKYLQQSIVRKVQGANRAGVVVGLSGGFDSTMASILAIEALGTDNVHGLLLPYFDNEHVQHAKSLVRTFFKPANVQLFWIADVVDSLQQKGLASSNVSRGNLMARLRMLILYDYAFAHNLLVEGTCNRSEVEVGYETKFGDGASDFDPLGNVFKTDLYALARWYNQTHTPQIPEVILTKKPSADLWAGQTDEDELDMSYEQLDTVIRYYYGMLQTPGGAPAELVTKVRRLIEISEHKRTMPFVPQIPEDWLLESESNGEAVSLLEFKQMVQHYSQAFTPDQFKAFIENVLPMVVEKP